LAAKDSNRSSGTDQKQISSTDRCYQRCFDCMPHGNVPFLNHGQMLRFEVIPFTAELRNRLKQDTSLFPINRRASDGPGKHYRPVTRRGKIGFIGAGNHHYCYNYNRLQITPEGKLRLFSNGRDRHRGIIAVRLRTGRVDRSGSNCDPGTINRCAPDLRFNRSAQRGMSCIGV
jgi:molybdenum cofactor biosynthesis enzyme MoaA